MQLDDNFKKLVKELGNAINDSLADSETISEVISRIRASGYDLFLVLEVTIGFNKRGQTRLAPGEKLAPESPPESDLRLSHQDAQFLRALKISIQEPEE